MASWGTVFWFTLSEATDDGTEEVQVRQRNAGSGSARTVASLMRAVADEIDPQVESKEDTDAKKLGEQMALDLMKDLFGKKG